MVVWMDRAATDPDSSQRVLEYNLIEHIAEELALYMYDPQSVLAVDFGHWIADSSINSNPMIGGNGVQLWCEWGYAANFHSVTFDELGLTDGTPWSITLSGARENATAPNSIVFGPYANGTKSFIVNPVPDALPDPASGAVVVDGGNVSQLVVFTTCVCGRAFPVGFEESGLPLGTDWQITLSGMSGSTVLRGSSESLWTNLSNGTYSLNPSPVPGRIAPPPAEFNVTGPTIVNLNYRTPVVPRYEVSFTTTGLPSGTNWSITVNGSEIHGVGTLSTRLANGSYSWGVISSVPGFSIVPSAGVVMVHGAPIQVAIQSLGLVCGCLSQPVLSWTYLSPLGTSLIAGLSGVVVVLIGIGAWRMSRAMHRGRLPPTDPGGPPNP